MELRLPQEVDWSNEGSMQDMWGRVALKVRKCCREVLGVVRGGRRRVDKEVWWWGDEVQTAVGEKKKAYTEWKKNKTDKHGNKYRMAKREAKGVVARAKARKYEDLYKRLQTKEGEKEIYQVARQRERLKRDVEGGKMH